MVACLFWKFCLTSNNNSLLFVFSAGFQIVDEASSVMCKSVFIPGHLLRPSSSSAIQGWGDLLTLKSRTPWHYGLISFEAEFCKLRSIKSLLQIMQGGFRKGVMPRLYPRFTESKSGGPESEELYFKCVPNPPHPLWISRTLNFEVMLSCFIASCLSLWYCPLSVPILGGQNLELSL